MAEQAVQAEATGRRKTSTARVRLVAGTGTITVNHRSFADFFPTEALRNFIIQPLRHVESVEKYDIAASVGGGGVVGQAGAVRHAISRALLQADETLRAVLKSKGCLTRDSRMKERKKPGQPGARKRFQFSKR